VRQTNNPKLVQISRKGASGKTHEI